MQIENYTSLSKTASTLSGNLQNESDDLIKQFRNGNKNPGIGTKHLVDDIYYLRGKKGARVFYRMKNGTMEILGKATKGNEDDVIKLVTKLFKKVT